VTPTPAQPESTGAQALVLRVCVPLCLSPCLSSVRLLPLPALPTPESRTAEIAPWRSEISAFVFFCFLFFLFFFFSRLPTPAAPNALAQPSSEVLASPP
jgi:hypothetical protein